MELIWHLRGIHDDVGTTPSSTRAVSERRSGSDGQFMPHSAALLGLT